MRRLIAFGVFALMLFAAGRSDVAACGEKFFFAGRLMKYQQMMAAPVPGNVLMYMNPASKLPAVVRETKLDDLLKAAGHKVDTVADPAALSRAVSSRRYDLLLIDGAEPAQAAWKTAAPGMVVIPVLYRSSKTEQQAAQHSYASVLKADKTSDAIALVNNLIKSRSKARPTP